MHTLGWTGYPTLHGGRVESVHTLRQTGYMTLHGRWVGRHVRTGRVSDTAGKELGCAGYPTPHGRKDGKGAYVRSDRVSDTAWQVGWKTCTS